MLTAPTVNVVLLEMAVSNRRRRPAAHSGRHPRLHILTVGVVITPMPAAGSTQTRMRYLVVCTASACRWCTLTRSKSRSSATGSDLQVYEKSEPLGLKQGAPLKTVRFWADRCFKETTEYDFKTVAPPAAGWRVPQQGPTINLTDERVRSRAVVDREVVSDVAEAPVGKSERTAARSTAPHKVKSRTFHYPGDLVDFVKTSTARARFIAASDFSGLRVPRHG